MSNKVHPFEDMRFQLKARKSRCVENLDFATLEASFKHPSGSANEDRFEKMKKIRELPASIAVKRRLRAKLLEEPVRLMSGWAGFKYQQKLRWVQCKGGCRSISDFFVLWRKALNAIEGHFGNGVVSYFVFLKWLFFITSVMCILLIIFIIVPQQIFKEITSSSTTTTTNLTGAAAIAADCTVTYSDYLQDTYYNNTNHTALYLALDYALGTGVVENTPLYIGYYSDSALSTEIIPGLNYTYNMPLAYLVILIINYLISLCWMVRNSAQGFKAATLDREDTYYQFCNHVFGTYDFGLTDEKNIRLKMKSINYELTHDLVEHRDKVRRENMSTSKRCSIYTIRLLVNIVVLAVLGGCGCAIYYATIFSAEQAALVDNTTNTFLQLLFGFLPSLIITALNFLVPFIFEKIVRLEDYLPAFELKLTLLRTVFLRLSSLGILLATTLIDIRCVPQDQCRVGTGTCTSRYCWESFIGSQVYKLVVTDFLVPFAVIFFVEFPRKLIATKCSCKLVKQQEFNIPKSVLDLVYSQALYWIGSFFSPLIPAIGMLKYFLLFYAKKASVLINYIPNKRPYRASDSSAFFLIVLLLTFFLCCIPVGYSVVTIPPSRACGPFRIHDTMYQTLSDTVNTWPAVVQTTINIIFSETVALPLFLVLCLIIYYLHIFGSSQQERVKILKRQLVLEGKDKKYLIAKAAGGEGGPGSPRAKQASASVGSARHSRVQVQVTMEKEGRDYTPSVPTHAETDQPY